MADATAPHPIANPIDSNRQGYIGKSVDRVDCPLKVSGGAQYAYEYVPAGQKAAYGYILGAGVAKGMVSSIDASDAVALPGVLLVMDYTNAPRQEPFGPAHAPNPLERPKPFLNSPEIRYYGEPVAFIVAESFETARHAATLVKVRYAQESAPQTSVARFIDQAYTPQKSQNGAPDSAFGDFEAAFASAPITLDATYTTPYQHHMPMEPHASLAVWDGDKLTLYCAHQIPDSAQESVAKTLQVPKENVRIICTYVGGGFGGKLPTEADMILSALAARALKRPVKTALTRQQEFFNATHRNESIQKVRLACGTDGRLTGISHQCWLQTATFDEYLELAASATRSLYAAPNRLTSHKLVKLDLPQSGSMRAPGEAIGLLAIEQAMDELAEKLNLDPIELRLRNEPSEDPEKKLPFSTRKLSLCLKEGAARFGWNKRPATPGTLRDGQWRVGYGVAAAIRPNFIRPAHAEVTLDGSGRLTVKTAMSDPGTGLYTVLTQIAAETMQVPLENVIVIIGDSDLPPAPGAGGSFGANSSGSAVFEACMNLRKALAEAAVKDTASPLYRAEAQNASFGSGAVTIGAKNESYRDIVARRKEGTLSAKGEIETPSTYKSYSQASYGGHFAEVGVDDATGEIRLRRMLGVFTAGRILNAKTARSQAIGGMIWGVSSALYEGSHADPRYGQFVNHDLAEYHVPVHADIGTIEAVYLNEVDDKTGPLGIKGVGELGICGAGAAVANAVYNACGVRVRDYPITLDKIIPHMAA